MNRHRFSPTLAGVITIVVVMLMAGAVFISGVPGGPKLPFLPQGKHYTIELANADALAPHAGVDIAGVKVGEVYKVEAVRVNGQDLARVDIEMYSSNPDIHQDARALLRPHGLFGPKFIELDPGHANTPLLTSDDIIPPQQTVQPVDLDQVLQELQANEQRQLQTVFIELGKAAAGRGDEVNHLFAAAQNITVLLDDPVRNLNTVKGNLSNFLVQDEAFNASFAQAPLDQWVQNSNAALRAFAQNSDHLQSILTHANSVLASLDAGLNGQTGNIRSTIEELPSTLDKLNQFQDLITLFAANLQGKEPGYTDVTGGIIGAIENIRSSFTSYDPCTPGVGTCPSSGPSKGQAHYVRQQVFNLANAPVAPNGGLACIPGLGPLIQPLVGPCPTGASTTGAPTAVTTGVAGDSGTVGGLFAT